MAISNFYLPTGLTVSGSTSLTGNLHVTENVIAESFTGSFSGSDAHITNINTSVLSSSNLYLQNPFLMIADTIQADSLEVVSVTHLSGVLAVSGTTYVTATTGSYNIINSATSSGFIDVSEALKILDGDLTPTVTIQQSYDFLRLRHTGTLDGNGFTKINLTNLDSNYFTPEYLDYVTLNTSIKEDNRWKYQGISVEMYVSGSSLCVDISAGPNDIYKIVAINEKDQLFIS
jgi:hypothetical protein